MQVRYLSDLFESDYTLFKPTVYLVNGTIGDLAIDPVTNMLFVAYNDPSKLLMIDAYTNEILSIRAL